MANIIDILEQRGYIEQVTDKEELVKVIEKENISFYIGIDPTADSLHVGHFVSLMVASIMQKHGLRPVILMGGGTAAIGDPSGKTDMRKMLTREEIDKNVAAIKKQVEKFVSFEGENGAVIVNNADWLVGLNYIDFMREIGSKFTISRMLAAECYKNRLETGLTFFEMGYMLMQAFDFVHLNKEFGCRLQIGGSDQWGNILAGADLSRKIGFSEGKKIDPLFGFTCPLLIKADGEKMGKTATGTLWVSRDKTTPFDFFQAWINSFDEDVERSLSFFTRMEISDIKELCRKDIREAKKLLAFEVTKLVHGEEEAIKARQTAEELFSNKGVSENMPSIKFDSNKLDINVLDLLTEVGIVSSKSEGRRLMEQNGISINQEKETHTDRIITKADFVNGELIVQKGKKVFLKVQI